MIEPAVGRIVWYRPSSFDRASGLRGDGGPLAAIVAHVHSPRTINVTVFDTRGVPHPRVSVPLVQDGEPKPDPEHSAHCEWMPYQKGQAAKAEALSAQLAEKASTAKVPNVRHQSDCAVHNEPALAAGPCDCDAPAEFPVPVREPIETPRWATMEALDQLARMPTPAAPAADPVEHAVDPADQPS